MRENGTKKEFQIPSDLSEVQKTSAKVLSFLKPAALSDACLFDIRLCLEESLINAIKYGNVLKKELKVRLAVEYDDQKVKIEVEDQGRGFDPRKLKDCTKRANLLRNRGRGVYLIHQLMDKVQYNARGNRLLMVKSFKKETKVHESKREGS